MTNTRQAVLETWQRVKTTFHQLKQALDMEVAIKNQLQTKYDMEVKNKEELAKEIAVLRSKSIDNYPWEEQPLWEVFYVRATREIGSRQITFMNPNANQKFDITPSWSIKGNSGGNTLILTSQCFKRTIRFREGCFSWGKREEHEITSAWI